MEVSEGPSPNVLVLLPRNPHRFGVHLREPLSDEIPTDELVATAAVSRAGIRSPAMDPSLEGGAMVWHLQK